MPGFAKKVAIKAFFCQVSPILQESMRLILSTATLITLIKFAYIGRETEQTGGSGVAISHIQTEVSWSVNQHPTSPKTGQMAREAV
jgi:hypothetical protein